VTIPLPPSVASTVRFSGRMRASTGPESGAPSWAGTVAPSTVTVAPDSGPVDALIRPENLTVEATEGGNGIVTHRTFLGAVSRVAVRLSGDTEVVVDIPSSVALGMAPGIAVQVSLPGTPVLVAARES
jgi:hypothetical protein